MDHYLIDSNIHWIHPLKTERKDSLSGQPPTWLRRPATEEGTACTVTRSVKSGMPTQSVGMINSIREQARSHGEGAFSSALACLTGRLPG
jgi:hypothetical protein